MKRLILILCILSVCLSVLSSCGSSGPTEPSSEASVSASVPAGASSTASVGASDAGPSAHDPSALPVTLTGDQPTTSESGSDVPLKEHIHTFSEWKQVHEADCTLGTGRERVCVCGLKESVYAPPLGHTVSGGVCTRCGVKASTGLAFKASGDKLTVAGPGSCTDSDLIVPDVFEGKPVTAIAANAFAQTALTTVTLPEGIRSIDDSAFSGCASLTRIFLPGSLTSIGNNAFEYCTNLCSLRIPENVGSIGRNAFFCCYKLIEVCNHSSLPVGKKSRDSGHAGFYAIAINSDDVDHVFSTEDGFLFFDDDGGAVYLLAYTGEEKNLELPEHLNGRSYDLYRAAFYNRASLESIVLAEGTVKIMPVAFQGCSSLRDVTIPLSIKTIDVDAFNGCTALNTVRYAGTQNNFFMINVESGNTALTYTTILYGD